MTRARLKVWLHAQLVAPLFVEHGGPRTSFRSRRGVALMLALVFIVLLTVLVVEFAYETEVDASLAANTSGDLEATLAAKSAVAKGMSTLWDHLVQIQQGLDTPANGLGTGVQLGSQGATNTPQAGSGQQYDSKYDDWAMGVPFEQINDATMRVTISDEYGKINLNALLIKDSSGQMVPQAFLINALHHFFEARMAGLDVEESSEPSMFDNDKTGTSKTNPKKPGDRRPPKAKSASSSSDTMDPTDAILDWLDYNEDDNVRQDGAEDDYYMGLERPYHCKNGPMDSIEELLLIKGITPEIYFGDPDSGQKPLSDFLTVHGEWGGAINVNTAPQVVIDSVVQGLQEAGGSTATPNQMASLQEQLTMGPVYDTGQLQQQGLAYNGKTPIGSNNANGKNQVVDKNKDGKDDNTGKQVPVDSNGDGKDDITGQPMKKSGQTNGPFIIGSNCFRIYGDGMQGDTLVRIEAYVWRNPTVLGLTPNAEIYDAEIQRLIPPEVLQNNQTQTQNSAFDIGKKTKVQNNPLAPLEHFRILDWKVIR